MDFDPNRNLIAIAAADKKIRIYNAESYLLMEELLASTNWIRDFSFYDYGEQMLSVGDDRNVLFWNLRVLQNAKYAKIGGGTQRILCIETGKIDENGNAPFIYGNSKGLVKLESRYDVSSIKLKSSISRARFYYDKDTGYIKVIASTLGSGLQSIDIFVMKQVSK